MSKDNSLGSRDFTAAIWAITFASFGLGIVMAFDAPLSTAILSIVLGTIIGQIFARWLFKRDPSILQEEELTKPNAVLKYSASISCFIILGLSVSYAMGVPFVFLLAGGSLVAGTIAAGFASSIIARYIEQNDRD